MFIIPNIHSLNEMKDLDQFEIKCFNKVYKFWLKKEDIESVREIENKLQIIFEEVEEKYKNLPQENKLIISLFKSASFFQSKDLKNNTNEKEDVKEIVNAVLDEILKS